MAGPASGKGRASSAKRTKVIDRSKSSSSRGSTTSASSRSASWKSPITSKVSTAAVPKNRRKQHKAAHSSSEEDDMNVMTNRRAAAQPNETDVHKGDQSEETSSDEESDPDEDEASQVLLKQNQSHNMYNYEMTTSARQSGRMTTLETQPGRNQHSFTPSNNAPKAIWNSIENQMKEVKMEKTAVHDFVSNYLFPKLKFLRGAGINLEYSSEAKSICGLVMAGCHQEHSTEGMMWWGTAKKQTINEIKRLRNDASKNLKISFLGKFITWDQVVDNIITNISLTYVFCGGRLFEWL